MQFAIRLHVTTRRTDPMRALIKVKIQDIYGALEEEEVHVLVCRNSMTQIPSK